jgi:hypothetical protein
VTVFIVSTVVAGVSLAVRTLNYVSFGVFADHELAMPGFLDAYGVLLRITPQRRVPLVSVPRESLKHAYTVSPTFRLLQPYFDGPEGLYWETLSPQNVADKHEIGQIRVAAESSNPSDSRIVLLAIFYATVWPGDNPRFIYPVAYLYPCAVLVLICCVARGLSGSARKRRTKWRKP